MFQTVMLLLASTIATLPLGGGDLQWGISEQALQERYTVSKAGGTSGRHGYTEFDEVDPVVYIDRSDPNRKIEFYFHQGKLYKTLVIHLNQENAFEQYKAKLATLSEELGGPGREFSSALFSMTILHSVWRFGDQEYDVRFGAGYVYEVRTHLPTARKKKQAGKLENFI